MNDLWLIVKLVRLTITILADLNDHLHKYILKHLIYSTLSLNNMYVHVFADNYRNKEAPNMVRLSSNVDFL